MRILLMSRFSMWLGRSPAHDVAVWSQTWSPTWRAPSTRQTNFLARMFIDTRMLVAALVGVLTDSDCLVA
jgi:hypothetical protein